MPEKESNTPAVFMAGGQKAPLSWEGEDSHSENLETELAHSFTINISDPHTWEYPRYYLVTDKDLADEPWGVVVIRDVIEWRFFDDNFDDEAFKRTEIPKHEYDTYVEFFGSLQEWPARVFFKRKNADNPIKVIRCEDNR